MRPDFALSLSFEGIALLRRAPAGWTVVGDVALTSPDLGGALANLRKTADGLSPHGGQVKLVIPNEQIRYLSIPDTGASDSELAQQIKAALDGATPYKVEDLVFDWSVSGGQVKVAAVARETLTEAEVFTAGHHFVPVCHVASAPEGQFDGEVFFGAATGWAGPSPERDTRSVMIATALPPADPPAKPVAKAAAKPPAPPKVPPAPKAVGPKPPSAPAASVKPVVAPTEAPEAPVAFTSIRKPRDGASAAPKLDGARKSGETDAADKAPPRALAFKSKPDLTPVKAAKVTDGAIASEETGEGGRGLSKLTNFGFLSRRKDAASKSAPVTPAAPVPAAAKPPKSPPKSVTTSALQAQKAAMAEAGGAAAVAPADEQQKMTVFGARADQKIGGKPRHLGLILTTALLLLLLGVAAWATVYLDDVVARIFGKQDETILVDNLPVETPPIIVATEEEAQELRNIAAGQIAPDAPRAPQTQDIELASLLVSAPDIIDRPAPVEVLSQPLIQEDLTPEQAAATYAATGIWQRAPAAPKLPPIAAEDVMSAAGIDPVTASFDAIALDRPDRQRADASIPPQPLPFGPDVRFRMNAQGLVVADPDGAVSPEGVRVFAGRPAIAPPVRPPEAALFAQNPELLAKLVRIRAIRPVVRPDNLTERNERAQLSGLSRQELGRIRPVARKASLQQQAEQTPDATDQAIARSLRPEVRPGNFARIVETARSAPQPTQTAAVAPRNVQPDIPTSASVARQATVQNAINLRRLNLIGVYGKSNDRRALVRLPNGRFQKVQVGDRLDGGRVAAISDGALRYTKGNRTVTLEMP